MLKRTGLVGAIVVTLFVAPSTAAAQTKSRSVMAGVTFATPGEFGFGATGALDLPTAMTMGDFEVSVLVGGFWVTLGDYHLFGGGGGLKWERPVNDRARFFAMIIAAIGRDDVDTSFGFSPGGGVLYNIGTDLDFFAAVGLGRISYGEGANHVGVHITVGVSKKLGR
jgi:hypothetical protein